MAPSPWHLFFSALSMACAVASFSIVSHSAGSIASFQVASYVDRWLSKLQHRLGRCLREGMQFLRRYIRLAW